MGEVFATAADPAATLATLAAAARGERSAPDPSDATG
jgi:hypothetical protein